MKNTLNTTLIFLLILFGSQIVEAQIGLIELPKDQFSFFQNVEIVTVNCLEDPNCPGFEVVWLTGIAYFDSAQNKVIVANFTENSRHPTAVIEVIMKCRGSTNRRFFQRELSPRVPITANCNGFIPTPPNPARLERAWVNIVLP